MEVNSMEEFTMKAEQELKSLADAGNGVAGEWLAKLQVVELPLLKLAIFGDTAGPAANYGV